MLPLFDLFAPAILGLSLAVSSCTTVEPWQRGHLAKPIMATDPSPMLTSLRVHTFATREAAGAATFNASGGGCGCN